MNNLREAKNAIEQGDSLDWQLGGNYYERAIACALIALVERLDKLMDSGDDGARLHVRGHMDDDW